MEKEMFILSPLEKVFEDSNADFSEFSCFSMMKNERKAFQIAFQADKGETVSFEIESPVAKYMNFSLVKLIRGGLALPSGTDDYFIKEKHSKYPDLLEPLESTAFTAEYRGLNCVWVQLWGELPAGEFEVNITRSGTDTKATVKIEIIDALLPEQELIYTNWFHTDCLMS